MGDCQNYGPFLGPYYNTGPNLGDPKRDDNFHNPPNTIRECNPIVGGSLPLPVGSKEGWDTDTERTAV